MACNPDEGTMRELEREEDVKQNEVLFTNGGLVTIKGCVFRIENIFPNPQNILILKCVPASIQDGHMI